MYFKQNHWALHVHTRISYSDSVQNTCTTRSTQPFIASKFISRWCTIECTCITRNRSKDVITSFQLSSAMLANNVTPARRTIINNNGKQCSLLHMVCSQSPASAVPAFHFNHWYASIRSGRYRYSRWASSQDFYRFQPSSKRHQICNASTFCHH